MAKTASLFLLLSVFYITCAAAATSTSTSAATNFIRSSCRATRYPVLCIQSLSVYAPAIGQSPRQLAKTSLSLSLSRARFTKKFVTKLTKFKNLKPREMEAIRDCLDEIGDSVDRLSTSIQELKNLGRTKGRDFQWHMSNVETWVSASLTDDNTCVDGFAGKALNGKIKGSIRAQVFKVAQVTSNALALVNRYASRH